MKEIFKKRQQTLVTNVDIFLKRFVNFVLNILQLVQIRNSSSFVQQSAKFIPKQLL